VLILTDLLMKGMRCFSKSLQILLLNPFKSICLTSFLHLQIFLR